MSIGITDGSAILLCPMDRRGKDDYHPAVFDARGEGVVEAAGRGIEIIPGSFSRPFVSFWRRGRDGYHPAVSDVEKGRVKEDET